MTPIVTVLAREGLKLAATEVARRIGADAYQYAKTRFATRLDGAKADTTFLCRLVPLA